jgi:hypothetical protein
MGQCVSKKQFNADVNNGVKKINTLINQSYSIMNESSQLIKNLEMLENKERYLNVINRLKRCPLNKFELNKSTAQKIVNLANHINKHNGIPKTKIFIKTQPVIRMINAAKKTLETTKPSNVKLMPN